MEAKLCAILSHPSAPSLTITPLRKLLKVPELKAIFTAGGNTAPPRVKADLIAAILASPAAIQAYHAKYDPKPAQTSTAVDDVRALPFPSI